MGSTLHLRVFLLNIQFLRNVNHLISRQLQLRLQTLSSVGSLLLRLVQPRCQHLSIRPRSVHLVLDSIGLDLGLDLDLD